MEECIFKEKFNCNSEALSLTNAGPSRIESIIRCSKEYDDDIYKNIETKLANDPCSPISCHRQCVSTYTSSQHLKRHLKRQGLDDKSTYNLSSKRRRRSEQPSFIFLQHCLFCGLDCDVDKPKKNPGRWRKSYVCRKVTADTTSGEKNLKEHILENCSRRNDKLAEDVRARVQGAVSDLHAADARYHLDCRIMFMKPQSGQSTASSSACLSVNVDEAFQAVIGIIKEDLSKIWNSIEIYQHYEANGGYQLLRRTLLSHLSDHFGDDLVILSAPGVANVLVFKSKAPNLMKLADLQDDERIDVSIKKVAKQIVADVKAINIDKSTYDTRLTNETLVKTVSETMLSLLSQISTKLDRTNSAYLIGNIITESLKNHPTTLQIALGILLRNSKSLVKQMHEFGVACSYDEVLQFKKSAALAATEDITLRGVSNCGTGMIQTVVDNFDADISSQNGKLSTHSLAILMTRPMLVDPNDSCEPNIIKRVPRSRMTEEVEYELQVEHYRGPKKPDMPEAKSSKTVLSLKVLASMAVSENRAQETDFSFFKDILSTENCPEFNGYNTRLCRETGQSAAVKTKADYLPLIDMTPSDPDTIMTAMVKAKTLTERYGQHFTVFTGDLQLYRVAVNILWAYPEQFNNVILRLGGMHMLMSFIGSIGTLMADSCLTEVLESTFGGVAKMLNVKKFPQNVRALRLVVEELLRSLFKRETLSTFKDLKSILDNLASRSRTAKLWVDCLIKTVLISLMYIRAEREGDWPLHLKAVKLMMPYFFAAGHINYARYGLYYLRSMESLPDFALEKFMKGEHVMRHIPGMWNGIWSDMFIETTFMRYGHGKSGIIGITLKPETLTIWGLSLHVCSILEQDISDTCRKEVVVVGKHKEEQKGRIMSDAQDRANLRKKLRVIY